jgi:hypothetical protein
MIHTKVAGLRYKADIAGPDSGARGAPQADAPAPVAPALDVRPRAPPPPPVGPALPCARARGVSARRRAGTGAPGAHSIFIEDFERTRRGSSYISLIAHISPRTPQPHTYTSHTLGMGHIHRDRTRRAPLAVHTAHSSAQPAQASCRGVTSGQGTALASRTAHPRQGRLATPLPPPLRGRHADPTQPKATLGPLRHSIPGARFRAQ